MSTHQKKHVKKHGSLNTKELIVKENNICEKYGEITSLLGNCQFNCRLLDGSTIKAKLRGKLKSGREKQRINIGDLVLIELSECTTEKNIYYIIHKYTPEHRKTLISKGELTQVKTTLDIETTVLMEGEIKNKETQNNEIDIFDI